MADWSMKNWKVEKSAKGVSLFEAFGLKKGTVSFPKLQATLPAQAAQSAPTPQGGYPRSTGGAVGASEQQAQALGKQMVTAAGWGNQWTAFNNIVMAESGWNVHATNGSSGAYGIPQSLPGSKMAAAGPNWQNSAQTQIAWMIGYIRSRYGNPNNAWAFHLAHGWY